MKLFQIFSIILIVGIFLFPSSFFAQDDIGIIPIYSGSDIRYDDEMGFQEFSFIIDEEEIQTEEGNLRRVFCRAPEGRSSLEILRNYEEAVLEMNGSILFLSRSPQDIEINGQKFKDIFSQNRIERGLATSHLTHTSFPEEIEEYLAGIIRGEDKDVYFVLGTGTGSWGASEHNRTFYELIILEAQPVETGMITAYEIGSRISSQGRIAFYNIHFDIGKSEIKSGSEGALTEISKYLKENEEKTFLVVGHTDSTGDFDMNIRLSRERAKAVKAELINKYGINEEQLKSFGVGPASPVASNTHEQGRARNRRVEIVEL